MEKKSLTRSEIERIHKEIKGVLDTLIFGCENLDMDLAFGMFHESPDFLMMGTGGSLSNYQEYLVNNLDYLKTCSGFKLTTNKKEIRALNCETAICAWAYRVEATLKTGEQDIIENAGASFVFSKINEEWKVVYYHESSSPPIRISKEN